MVIGWQTARLRRFLHSDSLGCVCVNVLQRRERIDHQFCSFLWKGGRAGYQGSEEWLLSKSDQGRPKVNKGDMEQEREKKWWR